MLIPKINIGKASHRNKFDLSNICHTTSEVGYMQPMFSKILSPHTTIKIGTKSLVRLSSLFVPTMGKLDLRLYHAFVPLNTIWTPFDAFLTGTDFTLADGSQYRPTKVPHFKFNHVWNKLSSDKMLGGSPNALWVHAQSGYRMAKFSDVKPYWVDASASSYNPDYLFNQKYNHKCPFLFYGNENGFIIENGQGSGIDTTTYKYLYCWYDNIGGSVIIVPYTIAGEFKVNSVAGELVPGSASGPLPDTFTNDWSLALEVDAQTTGTAGLTGYDSMSLYSVRMRRLRKCFLGLGYSFNPFDETEQTPFKLMAYYKAWYQLFYPQRDSNFFATNCYKLTKYLSENGVTFMYDGLSQAAATKAFRLLVDMINDLCDIRYILPLDYFSLADPQAETRGAITGSDILNNGFHQLVKHGSDNLGGRDFEYVNAVAATEDYNTNIPPNTENNFVNNSVSALAIRTAMKLMRFVNKNTVVGKKVTDILRMRFGVSDVHEQAHEAVYLVGSSKVDISISDVMATAATDRAELGDYAGKGVGFGESKYFTFDSGTNTGVFVSFAAIVPMTGYYQGMVRENAMGVHDRFDFYSPEYDALGYDDVLYNELIADMQNDGYYSRFLQSVLPSVGTDLGSIGFVPRYTHLKVSKDVCNGDISLHSRKDSMLPYTLDRNFTGLPDMTPENFRSLNITDFNRIFNSKSSWDDHFIIQTMFDVSMWADMKSIANTFDTFDDDGDTDTIEMTHQ